MLRKLSKLTFFIGLLVILALSVAPLGVIPNSGLSDELAHFAGFAALALAGGIAYGEFLAFLKLLAGLLLLATVPELVQAFLPSRDAQAFDLLANLFGISLGAAAAIYVNAIMNRHARVRD